MLYGSRLDVISIVKLLNKLKKEKKLTDYAIFGATAAAYYMAPVYTDDIDILVLAETDKEYSAIWVEISKYASKVKDWGFIINNTEVQILPTSVSPLYHDALINSKRIRVRGITIKLVDIEHLIIMFLIANRTKDRFKAAILFEKADQKYLQELLSRFDRDGTITQRLKTIY